MICRETEKKIFIYPELSMPEKEEVDEHIRECKSCEAIARTLTGLRETLLKVGTFKGNEAYNSGLTNKIMNTISGGHVSNSFIFHLETILSWSLRYSLAAVSLGLMILLFTESMTTPERGAASRTEHIDIKAMPVMDSKEFTITFKTRKAVANLRTWVKSECERICYNGDNAVACHRCERIYKRTY